MDKQKKYLKSLNVSKDQRKEYMLKMREVYKNSILASELNNFETLRKQVKLSYMLIYFPKNRQKGIERLKLFVENKIFTLH